MKILLVLVIVILGAQAFAQTSDTTFRLFGDTAVINASRSKVHESQHIYKVDRWCTAAVIGIGAAGSIAAIFPIENKSVISNAELLSLNRNIITGFDSWALKQPIPNFANFTIYALSVQITCAALPLTLFFNDKIRKDWLDILFMLMETNAVAISTYQFSPLGPLFQNKYRPVVYYDAVSTAERTSGNNRNSFYSGHTSAAAASTFFMAKIYCDYHPDLGADKYLLYTAAAIPPLFLGYLRLRALKHFPSDILSGFGIGAMCGILVPEIHRIAHDDVSLSVYTSPVSSGLNLQICLQ